MMMRDAGYREPQDLVRERFAAARAALFTLPALSPLRRAMLSPDTALELANVEAAIDAALCRAASKATIGSFEDAVARLMTLRQRADAEVEHVRRSKTAVPLPPAPASPSVFGGSTILSVESEVRAELGGRARISRYGVGVLAELAHHGVPIVLTVSGRLSTRDFGSRYVDVRVTASVPRGPRGPALAVDPRGFVERLFAPSGAVAIDPAFDRRFVTRGAPDCAAALLDRPLRRALTAMRPRSARLGVGGGIVELSWVGAFPRRGAAVVGESALVIVASVARRLDEA